MGQLLLKLSPGMLARPDMGSVRPDTLTFQENLKMLIFFPHKIQNVQCGRLHFFFKLCVHPSNVLQATLGLWVPFCSLQWSLVKDAGQWLMASTCDIDQGITCVLSCSGVDWTSGLSCGEVEGGVLCLSLGSKLAQAGCDIQRFEKPHFYPLSLPCPASLLLPEDFLLKQ